VLNFFVVLCSLKVWVLDATPGKVRAGLDGEDHPAELIDFLRRMPRQVGLFELSTLVLLRIVKKSGPSFIIHCFFSAVENPG
jgi:hypothetical protein